MRSFTDFWSFIEKDNPIWYEFARTRFFSKDIKKCAQDAYAYLVADLDAFNKMTPEGIRKYMVAWLIKAPDAPQAPQLQQVEPEPVLETDPKKLPISKSDPRYQQHLDNWLKELAKIKINFVVPRMSKKEMAEKGGWIPVSSEAPIVITEEQKQKALLEHMNTVKTAKRKEFLHYNPDASEEQIVEYIESFKFEY